MARRKLEVEQLQKKAEELMGERALVGMNPFVELDCEIVYCNHIGIQVRTKKGKDRLPFFAWIEITDIRQYTT